MYAKQEISSWHYNERSRVFGGYSYYGVGQWETNESGMAVHSGGAAKLAEVYSTLDISGLFLPKRNQSPFSAGLLCI